MKTLAADYVAFINRVQQIARQHAKQSAGWDEVSSADLADDHRSTWASRRLAVGSDRECARLILSTANGTYTFRSASRCLCG